MSAAPAARAAETTALEWLEPGIPAYHVETKCGRYSVSRVTVSAHGVMHYIAWRLIRDAGGRIVGRRELKSAPVPLGASDDERKAARRALQHICEADALGSASTATHEGE